MKLHENLSKETIYREFKEFTIWMQFLSNKSEYQLSNIIEGNFDIKQFFSIIPENINLNLKKIIPKYCSCFINAGIRGEIYLGVNDNGICTGIPHIENINLIEINNYIIDVIKNNVRVQEEKIKTKNIIKFTKVEIIHLDVNNSDDYADNVDNILREFYDNNRKYNDKIELFYKKQLKFKKEMQIYTTKLTTIINTTRTRKELINYVKKNCKNKIVQENIIKLLKTKKYIVSPTGNDIISIKNDNTHIIFWLLKFKDYMTTKLKKLKPRKPILKSSITPIVVVKKLTELTHRFLKLGIQYSLIKITIDGNAINSSKNCVIEYKDNNIWKYKTRTLLQYNNLIQPGCI